jgi:hypothetical protein
MGAIQNASQLAPKACEVFGRVGLKTALPIRFSFYFGMTG